MAHAHAELTGQLGVAMVTAGPGVTNCVTAMANASLARAPVLLIGGCTSRPQANMGPLQDIPHVDILRPVCRQSRTLSVADQVIREFDEAVSRAFGDMGEPGPVYLEIPTDVLAHHTSCPNLVLEDWLRPKPRRVILPNPEAVAAAAQAIRAAKKPLSSLAGRDGRGRGPRPLPRRVRRRLSRHAGEPWSRAGRPSVVVGAVRANAMGEADCVIVVGRKLDYQLGYGSPAVFGEARFIRIADTAGELIDNRRGDPELLATPALALDAIAEALRGGGMDRSWTSALRQKHAARLKPPPRSRRPTARSTLP